MGYTEEDLYDNDYVDEWNEAYDRAEAYYESGRVVEVYLNIKNPVYVDRYESLYDKDGNFVSERSVEGLKARGFDGIIDYRVSEKFDFQHLDGDTAHYIVFDSNQIKLVDNLNPTEDEDIRYQNRVTPAEDAEYLELAKNPEKNEARLREMVDAVAKRAGYTTKAYHGTLSNSFTTFDAKKIGSNTDAGIFGSGFYFTTHKDTAGVYATEHGHTMSVYLRVNKPWWAVAHRNIQDVAEKLGMSEDALTLRGYGGKGRIVTPTMSQTGQFSTHLQEHGYDAVVVQHGSNNYEIVVFDSNAIKSADAITYDDKGNVIPLSERFNEGNEDIRYSDRDYSYKTLISKPDMTLTTIQDAENLNRAEIVESAIKNAKSVGYTNENDNAVVHVDDIETDVIVPKRSIVHGLDRRLSVQAPVMLQIGSVLKNSIKINELIPKAENVKNTYVLIGAAINKQNEIYIASFIVNRFSNEIAEIDVLYSANTKKESAAFLPKITDKSATPTDSTISISNLLEYVNKYFPDILPEDILKHFGYGERPNGNLGDSVLFQDRAVSNREILVDAMSNIDELSVEDRNRLAIYREKIDSMNELERELSSVGKQIHEIITTPNSDRSELAKLNAKADTLRKKISRVDGALLKIEAMKPIQNLVEIRKKQIIKAQNQKAQEQRHRNVEGRNKTALKNKIKRVVNELNSLLNNGTKERNVKFELQDTVNKALEMAGYLTTNFSNEEVLMADTMVTLTAEEQKMVTRYKKLIVQRDAYAGRINEQQKQEGNTNYKLIEDIEKMRNTTVKEIKKLEKKLDGVIERNRAKLNEDLVSETIDSLAASYRALEESQSEFIKGAYSKYVYDRIVSFKDAVKGTKLSDMTLVQLQEMYDIYKMVMATVRASNQLFVDGKREDVEKAVSDEQVMFADEMQGYLTAMGTKGNEVSRALYGIDLFKEKHYFPLMSSKDYITELNQPAGEVSLKNTGMAKATVPHAKNPIVLQGFEDVWASHVNKMSTYHALVLPIENMNKVLNYAEYIGEDMDSTSVKAVIGDIFTQSATDYIKAYLRDLNGGVTTQGATGLFTKHFSKFKKTAVAASLSTVVQQPTAIFRAIAMINPKYFVGIEKGDFDEIKKYAPIAIIKEMGGFDAGSGRTASSYLLQKTYEGGKDKAKAFFTDEQYRDSYFMWGAEKGDELGWNIIWSAVKKEVADTTTLTKGTEEFLQECGKRFTEVISYTQVYDSVFSRSEYMRSKNDIVKMATAFMGEPTTSFNMLFNAVLQAKRGEMSKGKAIGTVGAIATSIIMAAVAKSFVYALRDDDEDESYLYKYIDSLTSNLASDMLPHNMLPFVKDVTSIFSGWEVERTDMAIFKDLKDAIDGLDSDTKSSYRKIEDLAGAIAAFGGIPVKNVMRTFREGYNLIANVVDDNTGYDGGTPASSEVNAYLEKGKNDKAKETIKEILEDKTEAYVKQGYSKEESAKKAKSALKSSITSYWKELYLEAYDNKDNAEMLRIRKALQATGLYDNVVETCQEWVKNSKNKTEDKTTWNKW